MALSWSKLYEIRDYLLADDLGVVLDRPMNTLGLIGEAPQSTQHFPLRRWFKAGPQQYVRIAQQKVMGFAWAVSEDAFAYVLTNDTYFDDGAVAAPPPGILPGSAAFDWQSIARAGRESGDHRFYDTDFYSQTEVLGQGPK